MIVMKFGGSSVGTGAAIAQVAAIVGSFRRERPVVVVSALQGVTDRLIALARAAQDGQAITMEPELAALRERHAVAVRELLGDSSAAAACLAKIGDLFTELASALRGVASLRELSDRSLDLIVSFGERLSAPIVAAALNGSGIPAEDVDARGLIATDDRFTAAEVDFVRTGELVAAKLRPIAESGRVPVVTGFIGATADGRTTTIGRGGSDYSATILGGALGAREIWIWKEVDGVMTADPGVAPDASLLPQLSYDEAAEMSYFGAKVLHPKAMIPAIAGGIPVRLRNTFRPEAPGTAIGPVAAALVSGPKVVTAIKKLAMVTVGGKGMAGIAGFAAHVFGAAGRLGVNILMFSQSSSEQNICLMIDAKDGPPLEKVLRAELSDAVSAHAVDRIAVESGLAAVAVVGEGMRGTPGVAGRVFSAVADQGINILAIAQGSSELNISFVVRGSEADAAVRAIHGAFGLAALKAAAVEKIETL